MADAPSSLPLNVHDYLNLAEYTDKQVKDMGEEVRANHVKRYLPGLFQAPNPKPSNQLIRKEFDQLRADARVAFSGSNEALTKFLIDKGFLDKRLLRTEAPVVRQSYYLFGFARRFL